MFFHFGKKVENWGEEVKKSNPAKKAEAFIGKFFDFLGSAFGAFFKVFVKLLGVFIAILGMILLVGMTSSLFGGTGFIHIDGESFSIRDGFNMFFESQEQEVLASFAIFLFIGVPLIMLVYGGVKLLLGIMWLIGLILVVILGNQVGGLFAEEATSKNVFTLAQPKCDTLFLKVKGNADSYEHELRGRRMRIKVNRHDVISADSANLNFGFPELNIVKSETDSFEIVVYVEANGKDRKEALHLARNVVYDISQKDSLVEFSPYFSIPKDEKWRAQQVYIEVRVPKGKMIYLAKNMRHIIYDVRNETDTYDGDMVNRRWLMGAEELKCVDCDGLDNEHGKKRKKQIEEEILCYFKIKIIINNKHKIKWKHKFKTPKNKRRKMLKKPEDFFSQVACLSVWL